MRKSISKYLKKSRWLWQEKCQFPTDWQFWNIRGHLYTLRENLISLKNIRERIKSKTKCNMIGTVLFLWKQNDITSFLPILIQSAHWVKSVTHNAQWRYSFYVKNVLKTSENFRLLHMLTFRSDSCLYLNYCTVYNHSSSPGI